MLTVVSLALAAAAGTVPAHAQPAPPNDLCDAATPLLPGAIGTGTVAGAGAEGGSSCAAGPAPDVYHTITAPATGTYIFSLCSAATWDTVLSLHSACPATPGNQLACDDDGCALPGTGFGYPSRLVVWLTAGVTYTLRLSAFEASVTPGPYIISVAGPTPARGACCVNGACSIQTAAACAGLGGTYLGDRVSCLTPRNQLVTVRDDFTVQVPDGPRPALQRTVQVEASFPVSQVSVTLGIVHQFVGDLTIRLLHGGRSATLIERMGPGGLGSASDLQGAYSFTDDASIGMWPFAGPGPSTAAVIPQGAYLASDGLAHVVGLKQTFEGVDSAGPWTLEISDAATGFVGTLNGWSLTLDPGDLSPCTPGLGACCRVDRDGANNCQLSTVAECGLQGGTFRGSGTVCILGAGNPVACCRANFNGVNGVDLIDIFVYLTAWFGGSPAADLDGVGGPDLIDLFEFLELWFAGCT